MNALTAEKVREHMAAEEKYFAELKPDVGGSGRVDRDVKAKETQERKGGISEYCENDGADRRWKQRN